MTIQQKRAQVSSISDEILGEDDLKDVDAVFESLLNSTFQEIQARGRSNEQSNRSKRRSLSSHPSSVRSSVSVASGAEVGSVSSLSTGKSSSSRKSSSTSVNRKQSRNKVNNNSDQQSVMPNKEVLADPLGSLPTSHTKKYLPRQQTWASGTPPPPIHPQTPSPTQSEYDTCPDPWEDY